MSKMKDDAERTQKKSKPYKEQDESVILRKLNRHLLPPLVLITLLNYIDRSNLAFAALQLNQSLGFTEKVYGIGSSIFFIGYALFQVPSNIVMIRLGPRVWLPIIIVAWGVVATLFAGLKSATDFYVLRLLLGVAESGSFPGMWYYLSLFYCDKDLGMAYSWVSVGTAFSQVIGSPLAAGLLSLDGLWGLKGWQWLFVVEGLPTVVLGMYIHHILVDGPAKAAFLTPEERETVIHRKAQSLQEKADMQRGEGGHLRAFLDWRTYHVALIAMLEGTVKNALLYWCPLIIHSLVDAPSSRGVSRELAELQLQLPGEAVESEGKAAMVALMTALPFGVAAGWMLLVAKSSQRMGETRLHSSVPFLLGSVALLSMAFFLDHNPSAAFVSLLGATIIWGSGGVVYSLPATFLSGPAAAVGIALVNTFGACGGIGPVLVGHMKEETGNYASAVLLLACICLVASAVAFMFPVSQKRPPHIISINRVTSGSKKLQV
ncbi:g1695 [Coccomyxa viridis]|uniref:G1695 protein n=1 Tax=Coccomyxa viridis TaxID=1274662 RepID=A0ABP1FIK3_9CHLO